MKKSAFTLAEVLITLGIIGVVSAITIPILIKQYQRIVLETQFKKAVSHLHQAVKLWQEAETEDLYSLYYDPTDKKGVELRNAFFKYIKGSYNPNVKTSELNDYYTSAKGSKTKAHYCPSSSCGHPYAKGYTGLDGIMYNLTTRDGQFNFLIDINGYHKGPNKWGIDLFDFDYNENNVLYNYYSCNKYKKHCCASAHKKCGEGNTNDGISCTACAVIDKDYFRKIDL